MPLSTGQVSSLPLNIQTMKRMTVQLIAASLFLPLFACELSGQDWSQLDTKDGREILVDTTLLQAVIVSVPPGEKLAPVTHPAYFFYALTDGRLKVYYPENDPVIFDLKAGMAGYGGPEGPHYPENIGESPVKFLLVELKEHPYQPGSKDE